jgi:transcriptional regulator with XRE-family HTH domain
MPTTNIVSHDREVGRRMRMRRLELGLSQSALGEALKVTFQQVQKYEQGTNRVSAGRLQHVAKFLKVPTSYFFDELGGSGGGSEISSWLASANALRLLKAFARIRDRRIQRKAVELVETIARAMGPKPN